MATRLPRNWRMGLNTNGTEMRTTTLSPSSRSNYDSFAWGWLTHTERRDFLSQGCVVDSSDTSLLSVRTSQYLRAFFPAFGRWRSVDTVSAARSAVSFLAHSYKFP